MTQRSDLRARRWRTAVLAISAALLITAPVSAQNNANPERGYSTFDLSWFAGWQWFQFTQGSSIITRQFGNAGVWGERATEDFTRYIGIEEGIQVGYNRLRLRPFGNPSFSSAPDQNVHIWVDEVVHLTPRESKYRPFIVVGPGYNWFPAPNLGKLQPGPGTPAPYLPAGVTVKGSHGGALDYGLGLKINATPHWGVRFDLRGMLGRPT